MKTLKLITLVAIVLTGLRGNASNVNVEGSIFLENQSSHSSIAVLFERIAFSALDTTVYTDVNGHFNILIETGIYNISFSKAGYFSSFIVNQLLYSNITIPNRTLQKQGTYIIVPTNYSTIQTAINFSSSQDTIIVEPGTYKENINLNGKNIVLASRFLFTKDTSFISSTIIDGNQNGRVITINNYETNACQIIGFTIRNGKATNPIINGAGIYCYNSNPSINNLIFENNNTMAGYGGGIYCFNSSPIIENSLFRNNYAADGGCAIMLVSSSNAIIRNTIMHDNSGYRGGGIFCKYDCTPVISNSIIYNNDVIGSGGGIALEASSHAILENLLIYNNTAHYCGGGISCYNSNAQINNVTVVKNTSNKGGGICIIVASNPVIKNSIIAYNYGSFGIDNNIDYPGNPTITNCNFYGNAVNNFNNCGPYYGYNVTTNINQDNCDAYQNIQINPNFIDMAYNNYQLNGFSSCIDAGNNNFVNLQTDLVGNIRIWNGKNYPFANVDMGAYEFGSQPLNIETDNSNLINEFKIFPNPANSIIEIELAQIANVEILNLQGQIIKIINTPSLKIISDISKLTNGIYFIKVKTDKEIAIKKLIKQ